MREASFMPDRTAGLMLSQVKTLKACDLKGSRVGKQVCPFDRRAFKGFSGESYVPTVIQS